MDQITNIANLEDKRGARGREGRGGECSQCVVQNLCLARGFEQADRDAVQQIISGTRIARRNEAICQQGEPLKHLMIVRSGSVKRVMHSPTGEQHILSFHLPGHVIGFDAMATGNHPAMTVALETSSLCLIPVKSLEQLSMTNPRVHGRVMQSAALSIVEGHERSRLLSRRAAEQRIAGFIVMLAKHQAARRLDARHFDLPMARQDIASYLCLAFETVSRVLSAMNADGVISVEHRALEILDPARLAALAEEPLFADAVQASRREVG